MTVEDPGNGWQLNPGFCPEIAKGKRVKLILENGFEVKGSWAADGRDGCTWAKRGFEFDIKWWRLAQ